MSRTPVPPNPWLSIPAADYEGHMGEGGVGQAGPLREIFARVYGDLRPGRLAVLGCGTGSGLEVVDAGVTRRLVGVDLNPHYLELARWRHAGRLGAIATWRCAAVEGCDLDAASFDLIHAALLFEYVDPERVIARVAGWLAPGGVLSVVLQLPAESEAAVSRTGFASLEALAPVMRLVAPERLCALASGAGLALRSAAEVALPRGKRLWAATLG